MLPISTAKRVFQQAQGWHKFWFWSLGLCGIRDLGSPMHCPEAQAHAKPSHKYFQEHVVRIGLMKALNHVSAFKVLKSWVVISSCNTQPRDQHSRCNELWSSRSMSLMPVCFLSPWAVRNPSKVFPSFIFERLSSDPYSTLNHKYGHHLRETLILTGDLWQCRPSFWVPQVLGSPASLFRNFKLYQNHNPILWYYQMTITHPKYVIVFI